MDQLDDSRYQSEISIADGFEQIMIHLNASIISLIIHRFYIHDHNLIRFGQQRVQSGGSDYVELDSKIRLCKLNDHDETKMIMT